MTRIASPAFVFALSTALLAAFAGPASAQQKGDETVPTNANAAPEPEHVDRVSGLPPGAVPAGVGREGVRLVKPGALLFANFDTNHDGKITEAEIEAGAQAAFLIADKNHDGQLTGFEQSDWATLMGSAGDVLGNPMEFDTNLDHIVTREEFVSGIHRLAKTLMKPGHDELTYADLIQPLQATSGALASESGEAPPLTKPNGKTRRNARSAD